MPDAQMETVTMVAPGRPSDETSYARDVVRMWDLRSHEFDTLAGDPQVFVDHVAHYRDVPLGPNVIAADRLVQRVRDTGCRVVLTGMGGDDWLGAAWIHIPELLMRGRVREFFDVLRWENEQEFRAGWLKPLLVRGVWPLLPPAMQTLVNRARGRTASPVPDPLTPEFAAATRVGERTALPTTRVCATRSRQELYNWLFDGRLTYVMDLEDRHHAWCGVEARHPFHDRRVIEFLLAIPEDQRWRSTKTKFILRNAAAGVLPDSVRTRVTKGDYSHAFIQTFDAFGGEVCFASLETAKRGWVDHNAVRQRYLRMRAAYDRGDESYSLDTRRLWAVFGIELWLRHARG
jgi:asparagine synthase (glutamine-hydrolysing)